MIFLTAPRRNGQIMGLWIAVSEATHILQTLGSADEIMAALHIVHASRCFIFCQGSIGSLYGFSDEALTKATTRPALTCACNKLAVLLPEAL